MVGKIDDNGIIVNKKKWCGCIWLFVNFEINKKLNNNGNFVNNSKYRDNIENSLMNSNDKKKRLVLGLT